MKRLLYLILMMAVNVACADEDVERPKPRTVATPQPTGTQPTGTTTPNAGTQTQTPTTTTPGTTTPNTQAVTFAGFVQPLYLKACLGAGCHNTANPAKGIPLETQADAKKYYAESIKSIDKKEMPISRNALTADEITKLKQWQTAGFP